MSGDVSDARLGELRAALEEDPLCAATRASLGSVHAARGETGSAVAAFQKALVMQADQRDAAAGCYGATWLIPLG